MKKILLIILIAMSPFITLPQFDTSLKDTINNEPVIESYLLNSSGVVIDSKLKYENKNYFNLFELPTGYYFIVQYTNNYIYTRRYVLN